MNNQTNYQIDTALFFNIKRIMLKSISVVIFIMALYGFATAQMTYTFTGEVDDVYENAENWTPAYPGTEITENTIVFIEGFAVASETIEINGTLHVSVSAVLEAGDIVVSKNGKLMNDGELIAASVNSAGMLNNNFSAIMQVETLVSKMGSMTNNLLTAELVVNGNMTNNGVFNNYSACTVEGDFTNTFSVNELRNSELTVEGKYIEELLPVPESQVTYNAR